MRLNQTDPTIRRESINTAALTKQNTAASTCDNTENGRHEANLCIWHHFYHLKTNWLKILTHKSVPQLIVSHIHQYYSDRSNRFKMAEKFVCFTTLHDSKLFVSCPYRKPRMLSDLSNFCAMWACPRVTHCSSFFMVSYFFLPFLWSFHKYFFYTWDIYYRPYGEPKAQNRKWKGRSGVGWWAPFTNKYHFWQYARNKMHMFI